MRVPEYSSSQEAPQAAPDVHAQALLDPAAGAVGQGLEQLGQGAVTAVDDIAPVMHRAKQKADALWAANAAIQHEHDSTTVLDGNLSGTGADPTGVAGGGGAPGTPESDIGHVAPGGPSQKAADAAFDGTSDLSPKGLLNEQGMAAAKYAHPTMEWIAQRQKEIAEAAPSPEAKQMFLEATSKRIEENRKTVERHAAEQVQVAVDQTLKARMAVGLTAIGRDITAPVDGKPVADGDVRYSLDANVEEVARTIKALHPGEVGDQQAEAYKQKATELVMHHYIEAKDWRGAKNLFDERRDDLGDKVDDYKNTIKNGQDQESAGLLADKAMAQATDPSGTVNVAKMLTFYRTQPHEVRTKVADAEIQKRAAVANEANTSLVAGNFNDALSGYLKNHSLSDVDPGTKAWLQKNAGWKWHEIEQIDFQHQRETRERGAAKDPTVITPEEANTGKLLADMSANADQYAAMPFDQFASGFASKTGAAGFKQASAKFAEIKAAAAKPDKDTTLPTQGLNVVKEMGHSAGLWNKESLGKMNDDSAAAFARLNDVAEKFRREFKGTHRGNEPTTEDYQKALAPEFRKVEVPGMIWGTNEVPAVAYETKKSYKDVRDAKAKADQASAAAALRVEVEKRVGRKVTDAELQQIQDAQEKAQQNAPGPGFLYDHPAVQRVLAPNSPPAQPTLTSSLGPTPPTLTADLSPTPTPAPAPAPKAKKKAAAKKASGPSPALKANADGTFTMDSAALDASAADATGDIPKGGQ